MRRMLISNLLLLLWSTMAVAASVCEDPLLTTLHGSMAKDVRRWDRLVGRIDPKSAFSPALEAYRAQHGYPIAVWGADEQTPLKGIPHLSVNEGPCGGYLLLMAQSLGATTIPGGAQVRPDTVVEFDASGRLVRQWRVPLNGMPGAVRGTTLFVADTADPIYPTKAPLLTVWLAIEPDGQFQITPVHTGMPAPQGIPCVPIEAFTRSDYTQCISIRDLATKAIRRFTYEGPCT